MQQSPSIPSNASEWRVGLARADITPQEPMRMGGYGARTQPSEGIRDCLRAKALAFQWSNDEPALLITLDLIGVDGGFAELVCEDIRQRTGLPRERILMNASHTHAGPIYGVRYPVSYGLDPEETGPISRYNALLRERLAQLASNALSDLHPARLSWAVGAASHAMNRRRYTPRGVVNAPYPRGYADRSVPALRVVDDQERLRAVLFGYACHNTTMGADNRMFSGDYAGFAQRFIERAHPGVQAMFLMGCGADANPYPRGTYAWARQHGEALGAEVCRVLSTDFEPIRGPLRIAYDLVAMPLEPPPTPEQLEALRARGPSGAREAERLEALLQSGRPWPTHYHTPMAIWQFGPDLTLVGLSGEVVSDYILLLERTLGPLGLWVAGYCSDYFGYLPSARVHREGGYEAHDFITGFGYLDVSVEGVILEAARRLATEAGRTLAPLPSA